MLLSNSYSTGQMPVTGNAGSVCNTVVKLDKSDPSSCSDVQMIVITEI